MMHNPGQILDEVTISDADFVRIAGLVRSMTGIDLQPHKRAMVAARLAKRLGATGIGSISEYCTRLERGTADDEVSHFINAYTTNMTRFYREHHHFEQLVSDTLPPLIENARRGGRVRIWSAGCSSGEEAYGIAFSVLDLCPEARQLDIKILASDIDLDILERAKTGHYPKSDADNLPGEQVQTYFDPLPGTPDQLSVNQQARDLIAFRQLNLHAEWPFGGKFDVIICRNVAIYFDLPTQSTLWRRFGEALTEAGVLYIGHSEGIDPDNSHRFQIAGRSVFRKNPDNKTTAVKGTS